MRLPPNSIPSSFKPEGLNEATSLFHTNSIQEGEKEMLRRSLKGTIQPKARVFLEVTKGRLSLSIHVHVRVRGQFFSLSFKRGLDLALRRTDGGLPSFTKWRAEYRNSQVTGCSSTVVRSAVGAIPL